MATYEESGVNISLGDKCSAIAYAAAKATFPGRKGMIGEPVIDEGGFSGALDMGDYYLVQNDDGIGSKMIIAEMIEKYDTMGYDLLAMVADDAVCVGAETISVTNTMDVNKVDEHKVRALMEGLKKAALEHKIAIPGGEIAELGEMVNGYVWNATAVGIVEKDKLITGKKIASGDKIIGFRSPGFRSNGFSLVRYILKNKFGKDWAHEKYSREPLKNDGMQGNEELTTELYEVVQRGGSDEVDAALRVFQRFPSDLSWGEAVLEPSKIYCSAVLEMHGRFGEKPKVEIKGIAHITGGGIYGNLERVLKKTNSKANLGKLLEPEEIMLKLMELGNVSKEEAYKTWNMGVGMILVSNDVDQIIEIAARHGIEAGVIGEIL